MGRVGRAEVCDTGGCDTAHLLVRGTNISFVSVEQWRAYGSPKREADLNGKMPPESELPSDITIPDDFVLIHDTQAALFNRCEIYIVKWHGSGAKHGRTMHPDDANAAREYFGSRSRLEYGDVEIPEGPWQRLCKTAFIRYRRQGEHAAPYEHPWNPHVWILDCQRPLAWKLKLPNGCIVDDRGFVRP